MCIILHHMKSNTFIANSLCAHLFVARWASSSRPTNRLSGGNRRCGWRIAPSRSGGQDLPPNTVAPSRKLSRMMMNHFLYRNELVDTLPLLFPVVLRASLFPPAKPHLCAAGRCSQSLWVSNAKPVSTVCLVCCLTR